MQLRLYRLIGNNDEVDKYRCGRVVSQITQDSIEPRLPAAWSSESSIKYGTEEKLSEDFLQGFLVTTNPSPEPLVQIVQALEVAKLRIGERVER